MRKIARTLAAAGLVLVTTLPAAAQDSKDREHAKALIALALAQQGAPQAPPTRGTAVQTGPTVNLTVDEAVARAMERNLTIASERLTPQTWDLSIAATQAFYRPNLTSAFANNSAVRLPTDIFSGGDKVATTADSWSGGLAQSMWRGGGSYSATWTNTRTSTDASNSTFNPSYDSGLQAQYTQPLMRNFKTDNTRTTLLSNKINQTISELNLNATIASTVASVRNAYWELVYAVQAVEAAQRSLDLSSKLVQDNQSRVEIGTMAPIDVVQAQAEQATRRQTVVNAEATLRNNELALKRLIVSGTDDDLWRATVRPTDLPTMSTAPVDVEAAVLNALSRRTDIETTRKNLELADVQMRSLVNQTLPQLDLVGLYSLAGRGGTSISRDRVNPSTILSTVPGGYFDALQSVGTFKAPTWNVRLQFAYPIGTSAPKANLARQKILREQTAAQVKTTELQIAVDVTTAALTIRNSQEQVQAALASRELSEKRLEAVQSKFEVGMSTNYEVVQSQRDLADARNSELRAQLNYQRALVDFQRAQISPR